MYGNVKIKALISIRRPFFMEFNMQKSCFLPHQLSAEVLVVFNPHIFYHILHCSHIQIGRFFFLLVRFLSRKFMNHDIFLIFFRSDLHSFTMWYCCCCCFVFYLVACTNNAISWALHLRRCTAISLSVCSSRQKLIVFTCLLSAFAFNCTFNANFIRAHPKIIHKLSFRWKIHLATAFT